MCFSLTSLCIIGSRFIHLVRTVSNAFFLWLNNIPLYICNTASLSIHLLMDIKTASMCYCKLCCNEYLRTCVFFSIMVFTGNMPVVELLDHMVILFIILKESPYCPIECLYQFTLPPTVQEGSLYSTLFQAFTVVDLLMMAILTGL